MIERVIRWSINRSVLVLALAAFVALYGALAFWRAPVDAIPDLSENQQLVYATWPGRGPKEIDAQLARPLMLHLRGIPGTRTIRGASHVDFCLLHVIFDETVGFWDGRRLVSERLSAAPPLPNGATANLGPDGLATGQIYWYTIEGAGYDLGQLRTIHETQVRPRLAGVPGVAEVAGVGGFVPEFSVDADPYRLAARGVQWSDLVRAVKRSQATIGGGILQKETAEFVVRVESSLGQAGKTGSDQDSAIRKVIEGLPVPSLNGGHCRIADVAQVTFAGKPRRGALEKDGNEVVGGVVLMRYGENPRELTQRLLAATAEIGRGLPQGISILPCYDRTPLIDGAVRQATSTVFEAMLTATIAVLLVLRHRRGAAIIASAPLLAALAAFAALDLLRRTGIVAVDVNIMSLAGLAVSIGVLVDSAIVIVENVMTRLGERFGTERVTGEVRSDVEAACREVGKPIFGTVALMLISFLPVFALGGMAGRMFFPLAATKSLALAAVAILSITVLPAFCVHFIRGRIRHETESWIVRGVMDVYRPTLSWLLDHPAFIVTLVFATLVVGAAPTGSPGVLFVALGIALLSSLLVPRTVWGKLASAGLVILAGLCAQTFMTPLGSEFTVPLDEGTVMDMPITIPRISLAQSVDDLKARDMILCRFPEVLMVVGKAGRADTPTDPAPPDMIETMIDFHPEEYWPRRAVRSTDAARIARDVLDRLSKAGIVQPPAEESARRSAVDEAASAVVPFFDAQQREFAYQKQREFDREAAGRLNAWRERSAEINQAVLARGAELLARLFVEEWVARLAAREPEASIVAAIRAARDKPPSSSRRVGHHGTGGAPPAITAIDPSPALAMIQNEAAQSAAVWLMLAPRARSELIGFGGELDRALPMPGWTNVWTMPIQNRVDMLATGINTTVGIRILGDDQAELIRAGEDIVAVLKRVAGAADVVADPVRGKGSIAIEVDQTKAADLGLLSADVAETIGQAVGGITAATVSAAGATRDIRVRMNLAARSDEKTIAAWPLVLGANQTVYVGDIADVRAELGPAVVKSENGALCHYVRFNVRGGSVGEVVADARDAVAAQVALSAGVHLEWTGQFEYEVEARRTLAWAVPLVLALILLVLYWTYGDWGDSLLILLAIPGAMAGGILFQWLGGFDFSVTIWIGYVACFGMAAATGIIMIVYLRSAVEKAALQAGGFEKLSIETLRSAVLDGAAHRLRPKLLTEATTILGLAPLLWASGPGAEVIRPMAAPVLGGILIADEVIDLLLPVLFFHLRRARLGRQSITAPEETSNV